MAWRAIALSIARLILGGIALIMDKMVRDTIEAMVPADGPGFDVGLPDGARFVISEVNTRQDNASVNLQFPAGVRALAGGRPYRDDAARIPRTRRVDVAG
jgi:hypothetical protein